MCVPGTFEAVGKRDHHDHGVSRRSLLRAGGVVGAGMALGAALPKPVLAALPAQPQRFVDLTHVLTDGFPVYPLFAPPRRVTLATNEGPLRAYANQWTLPEHAGTHLDAPSHFSAKGRNVEDFRLEELIMPAVVLDISARATSDPDTLIGVADLEDFEANVGRIPAGSAVLAYTGWDSRIGDHARFLNIGADGKMHAPGFSVEAADWLLSHRDVRCVGIDTISLDPASSTEYPFHRTWMPEDRLGLEILANLKAMPAIGGTLVIGAVPYEKGSGGQGRIFAIV